jgi:hypothetical protein
MRWSFYNPETGEIFKRTFSGSTKLLELNTPAGMVAIEGAFDHRTQRIDVDTKKAVDYQPGIDAARAETSEQQAQARVAILEAAQSRPLRELAIDPSNATAKQRLAEIDGEIASLRPLLANRIAQ